MLVCAQANNELFNVTESKVMKKQNAPDLTNNSSNNIRALTMSSGLTMLIMKGLFRVFNLSNQRIMAPHDIILIVHIIRNNMTKMDAVRHRAAVSIST